MPFLLDSVLGELNERGIDVRLVVHPVFAVERDAGGVLFAFRGEGVPSATDIRESVIHIHTERIDDAARREDLVKALEQLLADIRVCVTDWKPMLGRLDEVIADLKDNPPPLSVDEVAEAVQFLEWLANDNFTFLGFRSYLLPDQERTFEPQFETALGILRDSRGTRASPRQRARLHDAGDHGVSQRAEDADHHQGQRALAHPSARRTWTISASSTSTVVGTLIGEFRIVGLFTSTAYTRSTRSIPLSAAQGCRRDRRAPASIPTAIPARRLPNVVETYPRDELFQIDEDTLFRNALTIMQLDERPRIRVLPRRDRFDRFVSVLVYVPRDRFSSATRVAIGNFLAEIYKGRLSAFYPFFPEGPLVRVHFIIARYEGATPDPERASLEQAVASDRAHLAGRRCRKR